MGFTLVEVVVVIAIIGVLSAIAAPLISKSVEDARIARAQDETGLLAATLGTFYKDVGRWPSRDGAGTFGVVTTLISSNRGGAMGGGCTPTPDPGNPVNSNGWNSTIGPQVDYLQNHLLVNTPKGGAPYPTSGPGAWRGPYLESTWNDPWDTPYMVNVAAAETPGGKGLVLSAGPNMVMDTPFAATRATQIAGDDVGTAFTLN